MMLEPPHRRGKPRQRLEGLERQSPDFPSQQPLRLGAQAVEFAEQLVCGEPSQEGLPGRRHAAEAILGPIL